MTQPNFDPRVLSGDGVETASGSRTVSAPHLEPLSRSEGDLNRNSYRPSMYNRLATRAVVNDDGSNISYRTDELLQQVIAKLDEVVARLNQIDSCLREV